MDLTLGISLIPTHINMVPFGFHFPLPHFFMAWKGHTYTLLPTCFGAHPSYTCLAARLGFQDVTYVVDTPFLVLHFVVLPLLISSGVFGQRNRLWPWISSMPDLDRSTMWPLPCFVIFLLVNLCMCPYREVDHGRWLISQPNICTFSL